MKSSLMFKDQVNILVNWFDSWNECEQIVALYSLFRKLASGQTKFLLQVLSQNGENCFDIQVLENQANSPAYIKNLCKESKDFAVKQLLSYLPLLKSGNIDAKAEYLKIIPQILSHSIENICDIEESRQLLSYCLIHPAISSNERLQFHKYTVRLSHLEEQQVDTKLNNVDPIKDTKSCNRMSQQGFLPSNDFVANSQVEYNNAWQNATSRDSGIGLDQFTSYTSNGTATQVPTGGRAITSTSACMHDLPLNGNLSVGNFIHAPLQPTMSGPAAFSQNQDNSNVHRKLMRTSSAAPPCSTVSEWLNKHHEEMTKHSQQQNSPQQPSMEPHAPLSPQSSVTSSGSESQEDICTRNTFLEEGSGMRDVPIWLKTLRLHKYSYIFQQLTYNEMIGLTETWLESQNVTKGARHKIILSINRLKERQSQLRSLEKDIMECGNLKQALQEIKTMLNTPIRKYENDQGDNALCNLPEDSIFEGDLPGQITRVMGKLCTNLLVTRQEEGCYALYLQLLDKCKAHEAWTEDQKKKLDTWKPQIQKVWQPVEHKPKKTFTATNAFALRNLLQGQRALRGQLPKPVGQPAAWSFATQPPTIITASNLAPASNLSLYRNNSLNTAYTSRPPLYELQLKQQIGRTHSVPMTKTTQNLPVPDIGIMEPELAARLDSLCLSMTEHALGNLDSPEKGSTL